MTIRDKDLLRKWTFIISFAYVLLFCTVAFIAHLMGKQVITFWPIFSGVIGYLGSLGVANYISSPKATDESC